jgi:glutathione S-transferase
MKLYYSPGACSLAPHIVAHETGTTLTLEKVDIKTQRTASGRDFNEINPKGYVPALELDDGQLLTEGPVIAQYLADLKPEAGLVPKAGSLERFRLLEILGYLNAEVHKLYSPLFNPATTPEIRREKDAALKKRYALLERRLAGQDYLLGNQFAIADAYFFTLTSWAKVVKVDLSAFSHVAAFQQRVAERPAVQAALKAEGLA